MPNYIGALFLALFFFTVVVRIALLRMHGVKAVYFGNIDRKDFLIPPFAVFYFYTVFGLAFGWPLLSRQQFFTADAFRWVGVILFLVASVLIALTIVAFGRSFRVGIDTDHPDRLVTSGVFAFTRNPIYVGFWLLMLGEFLFYSNWILLVYLLAARWLFHRQVVSEVAFMSGHYRWE